MIHVLIQKALNTCPLYYKYLDLKRNTIYTTKPPKLKTPLLVIKVSSVYIKSPPHSPGLISTVFVLCQLIFLFQVQLIHQLVSGWSVAQLAQHLRDYCSYIHQTHVTNLTAVSRGPFSPLSPLTSSHSTWQREHYLMLPETLFDFLIRMSEKLDKG